MKNKIVIYSLTALHFIMSLIFVGAVFKLGIVPAKYVTVIAIVTAALWLTGAVWCLKAKKGKAAGAVYSVLVAAVLAYGSYSMFQASAAMEKISSHGNEKIDKIAVAVLADDPAETISDAVGYRFGVQYALKGAEIKKAVGAIEKETGKNLQVTEYENLWEQLQALYSGEVRAVILDEAYLSLFDEEKDDIREKIKIIYEYSIERKIEQKKEKEKTGEEPFAVYISGIDVYGSIKKTSRSDVNIMAFINPKSRQILLVTTPRDYYVPLPGISGGKRDKLTHAGIYGVDVSMAALEELYETELDYYARVNFTSMVGIIDALGGVDVNSEVAFSTPNLTVRKGMNHFDGEQALMFSRERHHVSGGDFQRGKDQQAVITAMIRKMISPAILTAAGDILDSVGENIDTDMSNEQLQKLIRSQLENPGSWDVKSVAAEGKGDRQVTYSMPGQSLYVAWPVESSLEEIKKEIQAVRSGKTLTDSTVVD